MRDIVIFGCGGLGQYVRDLLVQAGAYQPVAFLDSDPATVGSDVDGLRVFGGLECVARLRNRGAVFVVAIGNNATRVAIAEELQHRGGRLASAIHPLASMARSAAIGSHVIIGPRAIVCVSANVGEHSVLGPGTIVDHDSSVGTGAHVATAARLAGGVTLGPLATVGVGACVIPGRRVGERARVMGGAVVVRDVAAGEVVAGMPARRVGCEASVTMGGGAWAPGVTPVVAG